ncbi:fluoride efflux transporter CrcB [Streptomyces indicus]|uniref:Fluoride-specific ion channel FluC n=1 Tax=Streptomyces indicus TaxID=417292 RepID=A0A1G8ZR10_9ACTN|nr:fluoride efflux transporter CrcB [Streptomyces indicus]SDK17542.1 CrcB protein [Streptomyces indicus]
MQHDPDTAAASRQKPHQASVLAAVALGGGIGAVARHAASRAWPTAMDAFPWTTLCVNVVGCALIGILMVTVTETGRRVPPLVRPFLGTGVLGGFTTFSTYAVDVQHLIERGHPATALTYLAGTLAAALAAVWLASAATRKALGVPV